VHQLSIISSSVRLTNDETTGDDDDDVETTTCTCTCIASPIADVRGAKAADSKLVVTNTPRRATRATERYRPAGSPDAVCGFASLAQA
jgi:hypothetical protein